MGFRGGGGGRRNRHGREERVRKKTVKMKERISFFSVFVKHGERKK